MRILVPTDGSDASVASISRLLLRLVWFAEAPSLAVVNVHPHIPYARAVAWAGKEAAHRYYDEECAVALAPACALFDAQGIAFERLQRIGEPALEIVRLAGEWNADLVAMGRHGHSAMATLLMGSVTQKVLATAAIPVLIL